MFECPPCPNDDEGEDDNDEEGDDNDVDEEVNDDNDPNLPAMLAVILSTL